jgi:hypothetical protein
MTARAVGEVIDGIASSHSATSRVRCDWFSVPAYPSARGDIEKGPECESESARAPCTPRQPMYSSGGGRLP